MLKQVLHHICRQALFPHPLQAPSIYNFDLAYKIVSVVSVLITTISH
jgi:hypothetical protein